MDGKPQKYILLNDRVMKYAKKGFLSSNLIPTQVLRGEIFCCLPESEQPKDIEYLALRHITDQTITIECPTLEVSKLTDSEAELLVAVASAEERFRCYRERNHLLEAKSLNVGSKVSVKPRHFSTNSVGVVWYKGSLPTSDGIMFGVELLGEESKGRGTCDGTFRKKRYFHCPENCGIFVAMDRLRPYQEQDKSPKNKTTLLSTLKDSSSVVTKMVREHKLRIDQRVVVFTDDRTMEPVRGTVRYISEKIDTCGDCPVGIELDERKGTGTGVFRGKQRFVCKKDFALFAPVTSVITEEDFDGAAQYSKQLSNSATSSERQAHQETETRLHSSEQRSHELELSLATERQAHQETETRLHSSEQRSHELELSLATERQAHQETETRLSSSEQRSHELESSLVTERQAHQETETRLQNNEQRAHELETTLATVQQAYDNYRRSRESTRDWVLIRDEIRLSDKVIGIGAWGEVKEGAFRGCEVAVKKIHELILSDHNRRLFEREMNMASRCRHPCLLQFIGSTNDDQSPLFVTELLDTSLRAVLHDRPLEPPEITTVALDVAKGLNYLHLSHPTPIIHRDISSANVLLWKHDALWRAKVSDYGTANVLQQSMTANPGAVVYSAPEAQTSRQSPKLDVYSFGVLLCEMNVREMPDVEHRDEQVAMVTNNFFRNLIRRCLQQNSEERPSMAEIIEALENSPTVN